VRERLQRLLYSIRTPSFRNKNRKKIVRGMEYPEDVGCFSVRASLGPDEPFLADFKF
jgi:hypothetical protein